MNEPNRVIPAPVAPPEAGPTKVALRHGPPHLGPGIVLRGGWWRRCAERFDRRLTVLAAGAGFGKTTLLTQAVLENRLERHGLDSGCASRPPTATRPTCSRPSSSPSPAATHRAPSTSTRSSTALGHRPESVAFVFDDVHLLDGADAAWAVVATLVERLPTNASVVLSGRTLPPLSLAKLLLDDAVAVLGEAELAFTDDELRAFAEVRALPPELAADLPPWPALAVLNAAVGRRRVVDVPVGGGARRAATGGRQRLLALASWFFDVIDDDVVAALDPETAAQRRSW